MHTYAVMPRQFAPRDVNPDTGAVTLALYDAEKARRAISDQHRMALRTQSALRKLVLFERAQNDVIGKSEIADYAPGQVDPAVLLILSARDRYLTEENEFVRVQYFREVRNLYESAKADCNELVKSMTLALERQEERAQAERHHKDKMELLREKGKGGRGTGTLRDLIEKAGAQPDEPVVDEAMPIVIDDDEAAHG